MTVFQKIQADKIQAMRDKNEVIKSITTMILAEAKNLAIASKNGADKIENFIVPALNAWNKKLTAVKEDTKYPESLREQAKLELDYISQYLPKTATIEETKNLVNSLVAIHGKNIGLIMKNIPSEPVFDRSLVKKFIDEV